MQHEELQAEGRTPIEDRQGGARHRVDQSASQSKVRGPRTGRGPRPAAEKVPGEGESLFRAVFEDAAIGIVISDIEGRFMRTNPAMQRMLGYSEDELRGMRFPQVTHPDDVALTWTLSEELRAGKREFFRQEKRYIRKDGQVVWGDLSVSLVRDAGGKPKLAVGMVEYITERKRVEEEIRVRARQQASVAGLGQYALASGDLSAVLQEGANLLAQTLNVEYSQVFELLPEGDALLLRAGIGLKDGLVGRASVGVEADSQPGYTLLSHGPVIVQDLRTDARFQGPPLLLDHGVVSGMSVVIPGKDHPFGVLSAHSTKRRAFTQDDIYFLRAVAHVLSTAIERKRAEDERANHSRELTARVLQAQEEERSRIARELHDETVQDLSTLLVKLDLLEPHIPATADDLSDGFEEIRFAARRALDGARAIAHALRPSILDDVGLLSALQGLVNACSEMSAECEAHRMHIEVQAEPAVSRRLRPDVETALFRVAQEALTNACKHSEADWACVRIALSAGAVELTIEDNGKGFDLNRADRTIAQGGLGIHGMRERAALFGGELVVDTAPGKGARVIVRAPLQALAAESEQDGRRAATEHLRQDVEVAVLLVDDHAIFREGLRSVLDFQPGITVVGEAQDGRQAVQMVEDLHPDVVVMDIAMPRLNGLDATSQIKRRFPAVKVIILTTYDSREYLIQIVQVGAAGCVSKRSAGTELVSAIRTVTQGQKYISPSLAGMLLDDYQVRIGQEGDDVLSEREREVLQLVAEGQTNQEIARQLVVSVKTVEGHRANIMRKLGVHDRTDLVKYAIRTGMITPG